MDRRSRATKRAWGFTLIEVLVALVLMSVMALLAWRGLDAMLRSRDISQDSVERIARLQTVMAQWEQDLRQLQDARGSGVDALSFDGSTLRITRTREQGMQVVAWSVREGALYRWESEVVSSRKSLQQAWQRSQQGVALDAKRVRALEGVAGWQMYFFRGNSWSNAQSADDVVSGANDAQSGNTVVSNPDAAKAAQAQASAASGATGPGTGSRKLVATGVRFLMRFEPGSGYAGPLQREIMVAGGRTG